jgi:uncharacterized protein YcbK (DUF882 family)
MSPNVFYANALAICERAQVLRNFLELPLQVRSGYRTRGYNLQVGGEEKSFHLTASAMDLHCTGWTGPQLAQVYEGLILYDLVKDGGLGTYPDFIHIDIGPKRRWQG